MNLPKLDYDHAYFPHNTILSSIRLFHFIVDIAGINEDIGKNFAQVLKMVEIGLYVFKSPNNDFEDLSAYV